MDDVAGGGGVSGVDFSDEEKVVAWLEEQSVEVRCAIASRATLRVSANICRVEGEDFPRIALPVFRALLASAAYGSGLSADLEWLQSTSVSVCAAARSAASLIDVQNASSAIPFTILSAGLAALSVGDTTAGAAADSITHSTRSVTHGKGNTTILSAATKDTEQQTFASFEFPLWQGVEVPSSIALNHQDFLDLLDQNRATWGFWRDWYLAMWEGRFTDWNLAIEVSKIPDDVWEEGAEAVAIEIRAIERRLKTAVGPQLRKTQNNKWDREDDETIAQEPFAFAVAQVEVALASALGTQMNNGLTETSPETLLIRGACGQYREQHSVVATSFWNACMSLQRNIGDLYPDSAALIVLKNTLYTSVEEMCEQNEVVRTRIGKLAALEPKRMPTQDEKDDIAKVPGEMLGEMTDRAQKDLEDMVEIIVNTDKPPRIWRARLVNWITTIGSGMDKAQKADKRGQWLLGLANRISKWFFEVE